MYDHTQVSFTTFYHTESPDHVVAVVGSSICLGSWNPAKSLILTEDAETGTWSANVRLQVGGSFEWKLAILDRRHERIVQWEGGLNRVLSVGKLPLSVVVSWAGTLQVHTLQPSLTDTSNTTGSPVGSTSSFPATVTVMFKLRFQPRDDQEVVVVTGDNENIGAWNPERAIVCEQFGSEGCWVGSTTLSTNATYEWKMVCLHRHSRRILRWEEGQNRRLYVGQSPLEVVAPWNIKEVVRYSITPSVIMTPVERKSSDVDCTNGLSTNNNADGKGPLCVNFNIDYMPENSFIVMCVVGSCDSLGNWKPENALYLKQQQAGIWQGTIFLPPRSKCEWKLLMLHKGVDIWEPHANRCLQMKSSGVDVFATWNGKERVELVPSSLNDFVQVTFKVRYQLEDDEVIAVCGSSGNLGAWNIKECLVLNKQHNMNCWNSTQVFVVDEDVEFKLAVVDIHTGEAKRWEDGPNRVLHIGQSSLEVVLPWGSKQIVREVYPKQGEPGAKAAVRSTCLQQCFTCCCNDEETTPDKDGNTDTKEDQDVVDKTNSSPQPTVNAIFETHYSPTKENHVIALSGSCDSLGKWDIEKALVFERGPDTGSWFLLTTLPINVPIKWKMAIMSKDTRKVIRWEDKDNRKMKVKRAGIEVNACWDSMASVKSVEARNAPIDRWSEENAHGSHDFEDELVMATFKTQHCCGEGCVLGVIGSTQALGFWKPEYAALMEARDGGDIWETTVRLPLDTDIHWKMILIKKHTSRVLNWEEKDDRVLRIGQSDLKVEANWNKQEITTNTKIGEACGKETTDTGLKSVIKSKSGHKERKNVHFPSNPVAESRVKKRAVVPQYPHNQASLQHLPHDNIIGKEECGCDGNNNSLVQCCISYVIILFVCLAAIQYI